MFDKLRPLYDKVLIKRIEEEGKTAGGIIIPDVAKDQRPQTGEVLAVGSGRLDASGNVKPLTVKAGDVVFFGKYAGTEAGKDYLILREEDILGIVEKDGACNSGKCC